MGSSWLSFVDYMSQAKARLEREGGDDDTVGADLEAAEEGSSAAGAPGGKAKKKKKKKAKKARPELDLDMDNDLEVSECMRHLSKDDIVDGIRMST